ncbi:ABC transporter permease [Blastococcus saxobsidens]|uniref:NitT/TauT family transport system permease protein n=1 Tax=Blastococcus saxobsidens TaxID=138336 RepID=A0A4Q7Y212_9ACTN|nr:ABC transporter permease [Blastococcus saxobsidens]RZU30832.1 NitT/TauT family transport system permease protein [Blastococcus saxobsidens]
MNRVWTLRIGAAVVFLGLWEGLARSGLVLDTVLPPATEVFGRIQDVVTQSDFGQDVYASLYEVVIGVAIGALVGMPFGAFMGSSRYLYRLLDPLVYYVGAVPKIVLFPILILFLGTGVESKVGIAAISAAFPIAINTALAVQEVNPMHVKAAKSLGASRSQLYRFVYTPAILGPVLAGARLGLGVAITAALLGETKVANVGLGFRAIEYYSRLQIAEMYALLLIVFVGAALINLGLSGLIRRATHYQQQRVGAAASVA